LPIYGHRARIGYTSPPLVTETFPYEFYKMAPPGVTVVLTTLMVNVHTPESGEAEESWNHAVRGAKAMAKTGVDIIVLGGGPVVYAGGKEAAEKAIDDLRAQVGSIPVTNSTTCYRAADVALGAKIVGSVTYTSPPGANDHLGGIGDMAEGTRTAGHKYANVPFIDVGKTPSEIPLQLARELKQEHPDIDTIHLGSPHWACAAIIETIEQELGVNVVQGTQAILWHALRTLGIEDKVQGYGKLLREH